MLPGTLPVTRQKFSLEMDPVKMKITATYSKANDDLELEATD